jgi:SAM-dependent methyltransferase
MTTTSNAGSRVGYTLDNQWRAARQRLALLEANCDPITGANLDKVGVGPGWRCLEVGAGAGSVARMLCERVGPDGQVLAVDFEPALLADLRVPNLEIRKADVVTDDLPEAAFDLVHTRAVMVHIAQRDEVLPKLVRALRPGGVLLLEEPDLTPVLEGPDNLFRRGVEAMYRPVRQAGLDLYWPPTLPAWLDAGGLVEVQSRAERMMVTGGSSMAQFLQLTLEQFVETQPYTDDERAVLARLHAALSDPGEQYLAWELIAAWGYRA